MNPDKLKTKIRHELVAQEVNLSNNKLLFLTGSFNYFIDTKKLPKKLHAVRTFLVKHLEHKLDTCGIMNDPEKDQELRDLKHEFTFTKLKLTKEQITLLIKGLKHFISSEMQCSNTYLELKDSFEKELEKQ